jgi:urease alpha subunit
VKESTDFRAPYGRRCNTLEFPFTMMYRRVERTKYTELLIWCATVGLILAGVAGAQSQTTLRHEITAFVRVNVVPMDSERVLRNHTVLIENGKIVSIGSHLAVPKSARVVDGDGAFLSPGLADMHTHSDTREDLKVILANGVTSILNMGARRRHSWIKYGPQRTKARSQRRTSTQDSW